MEDRAFRCGIYFGRGEGLTPLRNRNFFGMPNTQIDF